MDIIDNVKGWLGKFADVGVSLLALAIVAELLGVGALPFMPDELSVIGNVSGVVDIVVVVFIYDNFIPSISVNEIGCII